jgi:uncharacterized protein YlxP (DUF503 family)
VTLSNVSLKKRLRRNWKDEQSRSGESGKGIIGHQVLILHFPFSHSLKDKRFILSGVKKKVQDRFHVSIAETGDADLWQKSVLEMVLVSSDYVQVEKTLILIAEFVASHPEIQILDEFKEYI